jgi:hypothetical protein
MFIEPPNKRKAKAKMLEWRFQKSKESIGVENEERGSAIQMLTILAFALMITGKIVVKKLNTSIDLKNYWKISCYRTGN